MTFKFSLFMGGLDIPRKRNFVCITLTSKKQFCMSYPPSKSETLVCHTLPSKEKWKNLDFSRHAENNFHIASFSWEWCYVPT